MSLYTLQIIGLIIFHFSLVKTYAFQPPSTALSRFSGSKSRYASTSSAVESLSSTINDSVTTIGNVVFVLPENAVKIKSKFGSFSPVENPSILEAIEHISNKVKWFSDATVETEIIQLPSGVEMRDLDEKIIQKMNNANALIAMNVEEVNLIQILDNIFNTRRSSGRGDLCHFALDCKENFPSSAGPYDSNTFSLLSLVPWSSDASGKRMVEQMHGLFERCTSDDFVVALMIFFNQYCGSIDWVKFSIDATWEKGPIQNSLEFYKMVTNCGDCITKCLADEKCKECLDELTKVDTRDQVASYRTIVSYESELLKDFSFCILQKNNIFGCDAKIPAMPVVEPMKVFKGEKLTKEMAKRILVGHLDDPIALEESARSKTSWIVACGANVAYDQFPSQNQIFYEASNGKDMWYDPVFRVETIDGRNVWCKRHYRVREASEVGTFRFSVLDNGVTSNEFWTIVSVADDLSWIVFHYAGAASAVGQRYLGGLICTKDGELPPDSVRDEIFSHIKRAGIQPWELFVVDNRSDTDGAIAAGPPPLSR